MRTRATLEEDAWVIRGDKQFITQGSTAGTYVIMASTDPAQGTQGHLRVCRGSQHARALQSGSSRRSSASAASDTAALHFDEMRVPRENLLGK